MSTIAAGTTSTTALVETGDTTGNLVFQTNGTTTAMTIDTSQNLGLGVTPSAWGGGYAALQMKGGFTLTSYPSATLPTGFISSNAYFNGTNWIYTASRYATRYKVQNDDGAHSWDIAPVGTAGNAITFTQAMTLDASGNFLVGDTSNYGGRLFVSDSVNGNVAIVVRNTYFATGACSASYSINLGNAYAYMMGKVPSANSGNSSLEFHTSNGGSDTTAATLDLSGNLTIAGSTATKASGTTWANPSDIRIKDDIHDYAKGLAELVQIRPRIWTFNGKGGSSAGVAGIGVIADEIESVLPETVTTYQAKLNPDDEEETAIKRFDASEVVWLLVNAVKELTARVAQLEGKTP